VGWNLVLKLLSNGCVFVAEELLSFRAKELPYMHLPFPNNGYMNAEKKEQKSSGECCTKNWKTSPEKQGTVSRDAGSKGWTVLLCSSWKGPLKERAMLDLSNQRKVKKWAAESGEYT